MEGLRGMLTAVVMVVPRNQWAVGDYVELMDGTMTDISGPCYDEQVPLIDTNRVTVAFFRFTTSMGRHEWRDVDRELLWRYTCSSAKRENISSCSLTQRTHSYKSHPCHSIVSLTRGVRAREHLFFIHLLRNRSIDMLD